MRAAFDAIEPGMRDRDVAAIAQCYSQRHGSENGIYLCASMPADAPSAFSQRHRVVPLISATKPCATTSCRISAMESRESGSPRR